MGGGHTLQCGVIGRALKCTQLLLDLLSIAWHVRGAVTSGCWQLRLLVTGQLFTVNSYTYSKSNSTRYISMHDLTATESRSKSDQSHVLQSNYPAICKTHRRKTCV